MNLTPNHTSDGLPTPPESFDHQNEKARAVRRMIPVIAFLRTNFHRNPKIEEIAAHARLSSSRLSHLFKMAFGRSIGQYLKELKLQHAKRLLKAGSLTVKEVMGRSGYSDQSCFTRDFKKNTGLRPSEYREAHLGNKYCNIELPGTAEFDENSRINQRIAGSASIQTRPLLVT